MVIVVHKGVTLFLKDLINCIWTKGPDSVIIGHWTLTGSHSQFTPNLLLLKLRVLIQIIYKIRILNQFTFKVVVYFIGIIIEWTIQGFVWIKYKINLIYYLSEDAFKVTVS